MLFGSALSAQAAAHKVNQARTLKGFLLVFDITKYLLSSAGIRFMSPSAFLSMEAQN